MYVTQIKFGDDEMATSMKSAGEIVSFLDMSDCYPEPYEIAVFESTEVGSLVKLDLHGCWHDMKNPLYIKATRPDGSIAFDGWGTDH